MRVVCHTDGSASPNPGPTRIGVLIEDSNGEPLMAISDSTGIGTSNTAEYKAILRALQESKKLGATKVTLYTDSQLCERQLNGIYSVSGQLRELHEKVLEEAKGFEVARFRWIARTEGKQPLVDTLAEGGRKAFEILRSINDRPRADGARREAGPGAEPDDESGAAGGIPEQQPDPDVPGLP